MPRVLFPLGPEPGKEEKQDEGRSREEHSRVRRCNGADDRHEVAHEDERAPPDRGQHEEKDEIQRCHGAKVADAEVRSNPILAAGPAAPALAVWGGFVNFAARAYLTGMANFFRPKNNEQPVSVPRELPILPLRDSVAFPFSVIPLTVGIARSVRLVEEAMQADSLVGLFASKDKNVEEPLPGQVHETGTMARILRVVRGQDGTMQVVVQGLERIRILHWLSSESYLRARVASAAEVMETDVEIEALMANLKELGREIVQLSPNIPNEAAQFLATVTDPRYLAYLIAANSQLEAPDAQKLLEIDSIKEKLRALVMHLRSPEGSAAASARRSAPRRRKRWKRTSASTSSASR